VTETPKSRRVDFSVPRGVVEHRSRVCIYCPKRIVFWTPTAGGSPLDVESAIEDPDNPTALRLESHFARCPGADKARRPRGRDE
jgi:hypothetical protein